MTERFRRLGLDYCFAPPELPVVLLFQRVRDRGDEIIAQVQVQTPRGEVVITRNVNLMASQMRGSIADLLKELSELGANTPPEIWKALLREATESVIRNHRRGRPPVTIEGEVKRPAPPGWACQGLLLRNKPNVWLGAASTGKSTLAKALCAYYAAGFRFLDRETDHGVPLYLDWEDDEDSFVRGVYDVCRNLGAYPLPRFVWRDMHGYRLRDQVDSLAQLIDRHGVGLMVLDAVAAAGGGAGEHVTWEAIALELELCLGSLPPVTILALDHVTGAEHKNGTVPIKARGAERKLEYTRNQWSLVTDQRAAELGRHVVNWYHTKNNLGPLERPFATEIVHRADEISIQLRPMEVEASVETEDSKANKLLEELAQTGGRSPRELALQLDGHEPSESRVKGVRVVLERFVKRGQAERFGTNPIRYRVVRQGDNPGLLIPFPTG